MKRIRAALRRPACAPAPIVSRTAPEPLGTEHRMLRWSDRYAPLPGWIVQCGEEQRLAVTAPSAAQWRSAGAQHVWAASDVLRTTEGLVALAEPCACAAEQWAAERTLQPGEAVTLALSVIRGLAELGAHDYAERGTWWLTERGRPVFVLGDGVSGVAAAITVLEQTSQNCRDHAFQRLIARIVRGLSDPLAALAGVAGWEAELLELAAPRPLIVRRARPENDALAPSAGAAELGLADADRARGAPSSQLRRRLRPRMPWSLDAVENVLPHMRVRPGIAGLVVAVLVLGVGLLWPDGETEATADAAVAGRAGLQPFDPLPTDVPVVVASEGETVEPQPPDLATSAADIVHTIIGCLSTGDVVCAEVRTGETSELVTRLGELSAGDYAVEVVEQFGDVAVVRVATADINEIVVLERVNEQWLLREVYAIAEQPAVDSSVEP